MVFLDFPAPPLHHHHITHNHPTVSFYQCSKSRCRCQRQQVMRCGVRLTDIGVGSVGFGGAPTGSQHHHRHHCHRNRCFASLWAVSRSAACREQLVIEVDSAGKSGWYGCSAAFSVFQCSTWRLCDYSESSLGLGAMWSHRNVNALKCKG